MRKFMRYIFEALVSNNGTAMFKKSLIGNIRHGIPLMFDNQFSQFWVRDFSKKHADKWDIVKMTIYKRIS